MVCVASLMDSSVSECSYLKMMLLRKPAMEVSVSLFEDISEKTNLLEPSGTNGNNLCSLCGSSEMEGCQLEAAIYMYKIAAGSAI